MGGTENVCSFSIFLILKSWLVSLYSSLGIIVGAVEGKVREYTFLKIYIIGYIQPTIWRINVVIGYVMPTVGG